MQFTIKHADVKTEKNTKKWKKYVELFWTSAVVAIGNNSLFAFFL